MLKVEVTAVLGIVTMDFFFHFNCLPGSALARCFLLGFPVVSSSKHRKHHYKNQQSSNSQVYLSLAT